MRNNELSAWTLLVASTVFGSAAMVSINMTTSGNDAITAISPAVESLVPDENTSAETSPGDCSADDNQPTADATKQPIAATSAKVVSAGRDWPQWGGTGERNNTPGVKNIPLDWNIGKFDRRSGEWDDTKAKNIRWFSNLGSQTYGNPVIAGGQVYVGTNNGAGHLKRYPSKVDLGCLLAFDEKTGDFKWQHCSEKLSTGRVHDWPLQGICCSPLVEGNRLWFVTSRWLTS
ncbi:MAG: PQQ-binding-like beta-propeller repeat protein [Pirellulaceae bacterium]|nr:PQQ-binding-like beta-propeller repeat protein [Pirellulaceae bacterium]